MMKFSDQTLAYSLARIGMGVNLALHGLVRIPKLDQFSAWMVGSFEKSWLPEIMVSQFAHVLPFAELILGFLLLLGLFTRKAIIASAIMIIVLIFGSCLIENWSAAGSQMIYLAYLAGLLVFREGYNQISLDHRKSQSE